MSSRFETYEVAPWPLVDRDELWASLHPDTDFTRARFRTEQERGWFSCGIMTHPRSATGRLSGSSPVYSALGVWASRMRVAGDEAAARKLAERAVDVESRFQSKVSDWLGSHRSHELADAPCFPELLLATADALSEVPETARLVLAVGELDAPQDRWARLIGTRPDGEATYIDLPTDSFDLGFVGGQCLVVVQFKSGRSVRTDLDAAVCLPSKATGLSAHHWMSFVRRSTESDAPVVDTDSDDGLSDSERREQAARYDDVIGRRLNSPALADLVLAGLANDSLPRRVLRPAG